MAMNSEKKAHELKKNKLTATTNKILLFSFLFVLFQQLKQNKSRKDHF